MTKKIIPVALIILMIGCAKNGGNSVGRERPPSNKICELNTLSAEQVKTIIKSMQLQFNGDKTQGNNIVDFAGFLTFQILKEKPDFDMLTSITRGEIYEFMRFIHIEGSEHIKDLDFEDVEQIKNCNWEL